MKMIFIGTGSAFTIDETNFHSNALIVADDGDKLLIDCGSDARRALHAIGYGFHDISSVYITHFHADHMGGLEWLGLASFFDEKARRPKLYIHKDMSERLWEQALFAGMSTFVEPNLGLPTFFDLHEIDDTKQFTWHELTLDLVFTIHVKDMQGHVPNYGLFMTYKGKHIFFTGDTCFDPKRLTPYYEKADIIFHDCETAERASGVHSHYEELRTLAKEIKEKMYLYHYNDGPLPDAKMDGFGGFIRAGEEFDFDQLKTQK